MSVGGASYEITVRGHLDDHWSERLAGLRLVLRADGSTVLEGTLADQAQLLAAFDLPIALMQDAASIERITHELVEDVATDGTRYVEIRW